MVIAAHFLAAPQADSTFKRFLTLLASQKPDHQFIFLSDEESLQHLPAFENARIVTVSPAIKNGLMLQYWYRFKLPKLLRKYAVDVFLTDAGATCESASIQQLVWLDDIFFLHKKQTLKKGFEKHWRKNFPTTIKKAARVIVPQQFIKSALTAQFESESSKIAVLPPGLEESFQPMGEEDKQIFLDAESGGTGYFLCEADEETAVNLTTVLKAYSIFKKRLKSSMKLMVMLHGVELDKFVKDYHLYKYRNDVIIHSQPGKREYQKLLAAAYATIYIPTQVTRANFRGLYSLKAGVPLIITDLAEANEIFEDAALYTHQSETHIAEQMMTLYKDEDRRNQLISAGFTQLSAYNWEESGEQLWQTILWHASYKAH